MTSYHEERALALRQSLGRNQGLTAEVSGILDTFHERLAKLEDAVLPVEERCSSLSAVNTNLGKTVEKLSELVSYFNVTKGVEPRLLAGPRGDCDTYFAMVDKLQEAVEYLEEKDEAGLASATEALGSARELQSRVMRKAEEARGLGSRVEREEFRTLLNKNARPADDYGDAGEEPPRKLPPPLPKSCTKLLKRFAGRMHDAKSKGRGRAYVDGRFPAVAAVLRRHGCAPPQKGEEAARLAPEQGRERAAAFALLLRWCAALLADERALAEELLHEDDAPICFAGLAQRALESCIAMVEPIIRAGGGADKVFVMLDIHVAVKEALPSLREGSLDVDACHPLVERLVAVRDAAAAAARAGFAQLDEVITREEKRAPSRDGNVDQLSSFVMLFLTRLFASEAMVHALFGGGKKNGQANARAAVITTIKGLFGQVEARARACRDASGRANQQLSDLFLMNNLNYAARSVRKTPALADVLGDEWIERIEGQVEGMCKELCTALWAPVLTEWADQEGLSPQNLSPKDRERVKAKFRVLNDHLQRLSEQLPMWIVPDAELRALTLEVMQRLVVSPYGKLYARFAGSGFTTNREKYLKHTPEQLQAALQAFFVGIK